MNDSREAEEALVGCVLIDEHVFPELQYVRVDDFTTHRIGWIWDAFQKLYSESIPIHILTVSEKLGNKLVEAGGGAYLTGLLNAAPTSLHAEAYGQSVHASGVRKRIMQSASKIAQLSHDKTLDIEEVVDQADEILSEATRSLNFGGQKGFQSYVSEYYDLVVERSKNPAICSGLKTGFMDLDDILDGFQDKYYLIAGNPGSGKTSLMLNCLLYMASSTKVLYVSREQKEPELTNILVSILSGINNKNTRKGKLSDDEWHGFTDAVDTLSSLNGNIVFETRAGSISTIKSRIEREKPGVVIIDSMGLLVGHEKASNPAERANSTSRDLKLLQDKSGVPLLVIHHMNRDNMRRETKKPTLADLRDGGEAWADVVMFVMDMEEPVINGMGQREIHIAKHRGGELGKVTLGLRQACTRFENLTKSGYVGFTK